MLYNMLTGRHAFMQNLPKDVAKDQDGAKLMYQQTLKGCPPIPEGFCVSEPCLNLLKQLLMPDPQQRITMEGIMAHPWFLQGLNPSMRDLSLQYATEQVGAAAGARGGAGQSELEIAAVVDAALAAARAKRQQQFRGAVAAPPPGPQQVVVADPVHPSRH
jgi:serine/threonine protein kinase